MSKKYRYEAPERKDFPSWTILNGKEVGIGGDSEVKRQPPLETTRPKECTQAEYKRLYDMGNKLVRRVEITKTDD